MKLRAEPEELKRRKEIKKNKAEIVRVGRRF